MRALAFAIAVVLFAAATGCGSNDCTETATCAETAEGGGGGDGSGNDVTIDAPGSETGSSSSSGGGPDGSMHADAGKDAPSDVEMLPDVPFVDSSMCPTGSICVDAVPSGWSGPVLLYDQTGTPPPVPPVCPSSYPMQVYDGNAGVSASPASCGCTCGPVMNASCNGTSASSIQVFPGSGCTTSGCSSFVLPYTSGGFCVAACSMGGVSSFSAIAQNNPGTGNCAGMPSTNAPAPTWSEVARGCEPTSVGGGCPGSQICVPDTVSPFLGKVCIVQAGALSCPSGSTYSVQHTFYGGVSDTRSCTNDCSCSAATGVTCTGGSVSVYDTLNGSSCTGNTENVPLDGTCTNLTTVFTNGHVYAQSTAAPTPSGGSCTVASSPTPTGGVTASMPTTVCCAQ